MTDAVPAARPRVAVLLATHNGARYLPEQLQTLFAQEGVDVRVIASDDRSSDATLSLLAAAERTSALHLLPKSELPLGNANRNFMRLIHDAPVDEADYVAFSDQDDLWFPDKLRRAVDCLSQSRADGYSANVQAFWPDGRRALLQKAQPQRAYDHLFESAGPGCTFVLTRKAFELARAWVRHDHERARAMRIHDWTIYALLRHSGMRWQIDSRPVLDYRQHANNELGANHGLRAALSRLEQLLNGRFRNEILALSDALDERSEIAVRLRRLSLADRFALARRARQCRRRRMDALALAIFFLFTRKRGR